MTKEGKDSTRIELEPVIKQLTDVLGIEKPYTVAAVIDEEDNNKLLGWSLARVNTDGTLTEFEEYRCDTLEEFFLVILDDDFFWQKKTEKNG